jgi:hypothetical protein
MKKMFSIISKLEAKKEKYLYDTPFNFGKVAHVEKYIKYMHGNRMNAKFWRMLAQRIRQDRLDKEKK